MPVRKLFIVFLLFFSLYSNAQLQNDSLLVLKPDRVFDGEEMHEGWQVLIQDHKISSVGIFPAPRAARVIELKGCTLLPGLIEGHSHLFLHPYNETSWNDQVLKESRAERLARATVHARKTLFAGFTTVRDLGTEGSWYDDAGLKKAIEKQIIPGPRMIVATRAIVVSGSYGPRDLNSDIQTPRGAAEADGMDALVKEVRTQIGNGADLIKVYADYYWGPEHKAMPTFTIDELERVVEVASSSGRPVVAHATSSEGMRRAVMAGVSTIEHGDEGGVEIFKMMKEKNIAYCPTLAASYSIAKYRGWKETQPEPGAITEKRKSFKAALQSGVVICMGGDVGVFPHGNNALEMELMNAYGMPALEVLKSATSVNAYVFKISNLVGRIKTGLLADILVVQGDPSKKLSDIKNVRLVMKDGIIYVNEPQFK
ncbi:MAG: amidohydrolase family protein [Ginsengibacter sp.]